MRFTVQLILLAAWLLTGCRFIAVATAPPKLAGHERTAASTEADALFWDRFHAGDYQAIPAVLTALEAAYLENPNDTLTAAHIGWLHIWRLSESARLTPLLPQITDEATLSRQYFAQAVALDPRDARLLGFYASASLAEASIHHDEKETREGYYRLLAAVDAYPAFNLFTAGYVMSNQPAGSPRFAQALQWQWRNVDVCIGRKFDRAEPEFAPFVGMQTTSGSNRVCWNSTIAPHNVEGFFLNFGDMLVKAGDWRTARLMYRNAQASPAYAKWPFRGVLERRIVEAESNVAAFNAPNRGPGSDADPDRRLMINTRFSCMACHQADDTKVAASGAMD